MFEPFHLSPIHPVEDLAPMGEGALLYSKVCYVLLRVLFTAHSSPKDLKILLFQQNTPQFEIFDQNFMWQICHQKTHCMFSKLVIKNDKFDPQKTGNVKTFSSKVEKFHYKIQNICGSLLLKDPNF